MVRNAIIDELSPVEAATAVINSVRFGSDILTCHEGGTLQAWTDEGHQNVDFPRPSLVNDVPVFLYKDPAADILWIGGKKGSLQVFTLGTDGWQREIELRRHSGQILCIASANNAVFSTDSSMIVQWNKSFHVVATYSSPQRIHCLGLRGNSIYAGLSNGCLHYWENSIRTKCHPAQGHRMAVTAAVTDEKGVLWTGSVDTTICIWDPTYQVKHVLQQHKSEITTMTTAADFVLSGSKDMTVFMWDVATFHCIHSISGHNGPVQNVFIAAASQRYMFWSCTRSTARRWLFEIFDPVVQHSSNVPVPADSAQLVRDYECQIEVLKKTQDSLNAALQDNARVFQDIQAHMSELKGDYEREISQLKAKIADYHKQVAELKQQLQQRQTPKDEVWLQQKAELEAKADKAQRDAKRWLQLTSQQQQDMRVLQLELEGLRKGVPKSPRGSQRSASDSDVRHILGDLIHRLCDLRAMIVPDSDTDSVVSQDLINGRLSNILETFLSEEEKRSYGFKASKQTPEATPPVRPVTGPRPAVPAAKKGPPVQRSRSLSAVGPVVRDGPVHAPPSMHLRNLHDGGILGAVQAMPAMVQSSPMLPNQPARRLSSGSIPAPSRDPSPGRGFPVAEKCKEFLRRSEPSAPAKKAPNPGPPSHVALSAQPTGKSGEELRQRVTRRPGDVTPQLPASVPPSMPSIATPAPTVVAVAAAQKLPAAPAEKPPAPAPLAAAVGEPSAPTPLPPPPTVPPAAPAPAPASGPGPAPVAVPTSPARNAVETPSVASPSTATEGLSPRPAPAVVEESVLSAAAARTHATVTKLAETPHPLSHDTRSALERAKAQHAALLQKLRALDGDSNSDTD